MHAVYTTTPCYQLKLHSPADPTVASPTLRLHPSRRNGRLKSTHSFWRTLYYKQPGWGPAVYNVLLMWQNKIHTHKVKQKFTFLGSYALFIFLFEDEVYSNSFQFFIYLFMYWLNKAKFNYRVCSNKGNKKETHIHKERQFYSLCDNNKMMTKIILIILIREIILFSWGEKKKIYFLGCNFSPINTKVAL
jgi:hypothetical protein